MDSIDVDPGRIDPTEAACNELEASYSRHLLLDHIVEPDHATDRERFEALAHALRGVIGPRWLETQEAYDRANPKRVYYLSMEYLIGRSLANNIDNLEVEAGVQALAAEKGFDLDRLIEAEPDAGLGNGGLGRLAACYMDSLATLGFPAIGYGLRYEYGMFRQEIRDGRQVEQPDDWLRFPDPWEIVRPDEAVETQVGGGLGSEDEVAAFLGRGATTICGIPCDRPFVAYGRTTVNTLRLWQASAPASFDLDEFNRGDYLGAVHDKVLSENLTGVLYPDDTTSAGRRLRFLQEYFLVACSLADILRKFRSANDDWATLPDKVAIQLNDTHPSLSVSELMRSCLTMFTWAGMRHGI